MILQNSRTIPGQKGTFFSSSRSFPRQDQIQGFFQVCANPVRACLILYAILTPKFNLWIYVRVMECAHCFIHCDLDLRSQFLKKSTHSGSPILFMVAFHIWYVQSGAKLKFTKWISRQKIMLIFNTYNTLNLKETIHSIKKVYVWIQHYTLYHYKWSENFTRQKWPNLPYLVH